MNQNLNILIVDDDRRMTRTLATESALLRGADRVLLPGVGHWPQLEDPEGFEAALLDFLAGPAPVLH